MTKPKETNSGRQTKVTVIDKHCGYGKTTEMLASFNPDEKYLVVVPELSEVDRVIIQANISFVEPSDTEGTKRDNLELLLQSRSNIVTTHALYKRVATLARQGKLNDYHVIVDEVPETCSAVNGKTPRSFERFYLEDGYAELEADGRVFPTAAWTEEYDSVSDTLSKELYHLADAGMLHWIDNKFFMWKLPTELLTHAKSFTVFTYMAEGSMLLPYLKKLGVEYRIIRDNEANKTFKDDARRLISIRPIPALDRVKFSYSAQRQYAKKYASKVAGALYWVKRNELFSEDGRPVENSDVMITSAKSSWFKSDGRSGLSSKAGPYAVKSRLFADTNWVANTTRGTNKYINCSHLFYLYDQHINPYIRRWLEVEHDFDDQYALTELIQWVYRSRVRRGEPITVYIPSERMRRIFENWLSSSETLGA